MSKKKNDSDIEKTKQKLLKNYKKHLDEIFSPDTFNLNFEQRENLIHSKIEKEMNEVIEDHIDKDPQGISNAPEETYLCECDTEALLCRDTDGNPKIFEKEIKTKSGPVKIKEYGYYCSKHRKIFFPSQKDS